MQQQLTSAGIHHIELPIFKQICGTKTFLHALGNNSAANKTSD